jgi:serine protease Do
MVNFASRIFAMVLLGVASLIPLDARAQASQPTASGSFAVGAGFGDIGARLEPAVVAISATIAPRAGPRDRNQQGGTGQASGSGFVIDASGIVVTNNHVIEGAAALEVIFADGRRLPASLVGRDVETDIAVLRINGGRNLASVPWGNSDQARIGDWAIAIGSPFGLGNSLSVGVVSGRNRDLQAGRFDDFIQTDAAINRGNSGGPLFNARGEVIGVNTAIVSPGGAQGGSVGVGFAVPSNLAKRIVADIVRTGSVQRGWLGLRARLLTAEEGGTGQNGVVVAEVAPNSPAAIGGLRRGDRIFSWAGQAVTDPRSLARFTAGAVAGSRVRIDGARGRQRIYANVTIGRPPAEARPPAVSSAPIANALGLTLRAAVASDRPRLPVGVLVVVTGVDAFGPGRDLVRAGDGLMEVQGRPIRTPQEARAALDEAARRRDAVVVRVFRDGQAMYRALRPKRR